MPNGRFTAGVRLVVRSALLVSSLLFANAPIWGQLYFGNSYDARVGLNWPFGYSVGEPRGTIGDAIPDFPPPPRVGPPGTISSDVLRNPISSKALRTLQRAMHNAELGDHPAAIDALQDILVKQPAAAPYIHHLLGIEYLETHQFAAALSSFEEAARSMPHDSTAHSNYGLSLALTGQFDHAETELRKALELDRTNAKAKSILEVVLVIRRAPIQAAVAAGLTP